MTKLPTHILLLEDDAAHAELVQRAFESRGDNVRLSIANTLAQAREFARRDPPQLIIADWRLPDGAGIDLLSDARAQIPIVIMTSYGNERVAVEALKAGALDYIVKTEESLFDMPHIAARALTQWTLAAEQARMQEQLRENEERFRSFIEQSSEGVALIDEQGKVIEWNPSNERITGLPRDQVIGMAVGDVLRQILPPNLQSPEVHQHIHDGIATALRTGQFVDFAQPTKAAIVRADGETRIVQQTTFPIATQKGFRIGSVTRDVTDRRQREHELQAIAALSAAMRTAPTRAEMLPVILNQVVTLLNADAASLEMLDAFTGDAVIELAHGAWTPATGQHIPRGKGLNVYLDGADKVYLNNNLADESHAHFPTLFRLCRACAGVPLTAQDQIFGYLWIGRQTTISDVDVRLLAATADIAANAIHRATLYEQTQQNAIELAEAYDETIAGWSRVLDLRDNETEGHSRRVAELALQLARDLGMADADLVHLRRGALLHDLGKMAIPDHILRKPGPLTEDEWRVMHQHPEYAYTMIAPIAYLRPALDIPYCHHERWNGTGYPRGLTGAEIPLAARIFAIVDVWDALSSDRPYRRSWSPNAVIDYIRTNSGTEFDPRVVDAFLELVHRERESI